MPRVLSAGRSSRFIRNCSRKKRRRSKPSVNYKKKKPEELQGTYSSDDNKHEIRHTNCIHTREISQWVALDGTEFVFSRRINPRKQFILLYLSPCCIILVKRHFLDDRALRFLMRRWRYEDAVLGLSEENRRISERKEKNLSRSSGKTRKT